MNALVLKPSPAQPAVEVTAFLDHHLPGVGQRGISTRTAGRSGMAQKFFPTNAAAAVYAISADAAGAEVFFALQTFRTENGGRRGDNVAATRSFGIDIDVGPGKPYATTLDAAKALVDFCAELGLTKATVVESGGGGLHAYWPMTADLTPDQWKITATMLKAAALKQGLHADPSRTADIASLFRLPGTTHRKARPAPVKLARKSAQIPLDAFREVLANYLGLSAADADDLPPTPAHIQGAVSNSDLTGGMAYPPSFADRIADQCAVVELIRDTRGKVDQPTWYHGLQLLNRCEDGKEKAHDWSKGDSRYDARQVDDILARVAPHGPTLCAKFAEHQPKLCAGCPQSGKIKSPIVLGVAPSVPAVVTTASKADVFGTASGRALSLNDLNPTPLTSIPAFLDGDTDEAITLANRVFVMVHRLDGAVFGPALIDASGEFRKIDPATGRVLTANNFVKVTHDDKPKYPLLFDYWMAHPRRLSFENAAFCPPGSDVTLGPRDLNLYRGHGVRAVKGGCPRILRHLRRGIAASDPDLFKYLVRLIAHMVIKPGERAGVAVILQGDVEGGGKSLLLNLLARLIGAHALSIATTERTNSRFNGQVANKIAVLAHEGLLGVGMGETNRLKSAITDPYIEIEEKGREVRIVPNYARYWLATNEPFAVHAGKGARRFLVCRTSNRYVGNHPYFDALRHEIDNGGAEAFLYFLLNHVDITGFNAGADMPRTEALAEQQRLSAPVEVRWGLEVADEPEIHLVRLGHAHLTSDLYASLKAFAVTHRAKVPGATAFGRWLSGLGLARASVSAGPSGRGRGWIIPDAQTFRDAIERSAGIHA